MLTLQSCINSLQEGGQEDIKKAKKEVRHIWRQLPQSRQKRQKFVEIYLEELDRFERIQNKRNQLAFISSLRYLFMEAANHKGHFLACRDFVLKHIQHSSGHIRQAVVKASDWLVLSLNVDGVLPADNRSAKNGNNDTHQKWFCEFAQKIDELLEYYEDRKLKRYKYIDNMPSGVYKSLQFLMFNLLRTDESRRIYREYRRQGGQPNASRQENPVEVPKWMDCTWKRLPCGESDCPICSREIPLSGSPREADKDVSGFLDDVLSDLAGHYSGIKDQAARQGIGKASGAAELQPPQPSQFLLYNRLQVLRDDLLSVAEEAADSGSFWPATEPGQDLLWYANVLLGKTYRQLCNAWYVEQGHNNDKVDQRYTSHVLLECLSYIRSSLEELVELEVEESNTLELIRLYLPGVQQEILNIGN
jgi:hypothetical protein